MTPATSTPTPAVEFVAYLPEPSQGPHRSPWGADKADALRANPNRIAIIDRAPAGTKESRALGGRSGLVKRGQHGPWADEAGRFDAWTRTVDGETRLYARYVQEPGLVSHSLAA